MRLKSIWSNSELVFLNLSAIHHCRRVPVEAQLYFILTSNESVRIHCQIPDYARAGCCGIHVTLIAATSIATSRDVDEVVIPDDVHLWVSGGKVGCIFFFILLCYQAETKLWMVQLVRQTHVSGWYLGFYSHLMGTSADWPMTACIHQSIITSSLVPRLLVGG